MMKAGIIGLGYVGGAIAHACAKRDALFETFDIDETKNPTCNSINELVEKSDIIYIAVPTPMLLNENGACDTSILENVLKQLDEVATSKICIIKSTVPPMTTEQMQYKYKNNHILFSPEFLTEANYLNDFLNQPILLIGKPNDCPEEIAYKAIAHQAHLMETICEANIVSSTDAEFYKYTANIFLATKVSFANEMSSVATEFGVDWKNISDLLQKDHRMGKSHWKVPGPDGKHGFGGTCFPKDLNALKFLAKSIGVWTPIIDAVWDRNITVDRPQQDWKNLKGRAVN